MPIEPIKEISSNIEIQVSPAFSPENSKPQYGHYVFTYRIKIKNLGPKTVQLLNRHWVIQDGFGNLEHVRGPGVVGEQPTLNQNEEFEYESFCPLPTPVGVMRGEYEFQDEAGEKFLAKIPEFQLHEPRSFH